MSFGWGHVEVHPQPPQSRGGNYRPKLACPSGAGANGRGNDRYLSSGGGVNSTALMLYLIDQGEQFESVYADHGGDYPETLEYIKMLQTRGYQITVLETREEGLPLYEYCCKYRMCPSIWQRWCTDRFKVRPLRAYFQLPATVYIGFDAGEERRIKPLTTDGLTYEYPLFEAGIDRQGCVDLIEAHGLPIPPKSGCYFCPFQRVGEWRQLRDKYPDLWCKTKKMEALIIAKREEQGKPPFYINKKPLDQVVNEGQDDMFGWRKPCNCGL
ncbi:hypothetical protein LCGC14_1356580 [marine sediment metagenome]|uniref:Phosphoadenosine phosphosulphate reductase domain-containing protein n=1 Tax=marine sediment metagenome TaxID=412755 RepID=A0A0F9MPU4_9ZZZZ